MFCFIILHYKVYRETIQCVNSILNNVTGKKKIIIVDNCSPDNSFSILSNYYDDNTVVDVIKTNQNLGFANGNNFGYEYCLKKYNPSFIVVMNNDMTILQSSFIKKIQESYAQHHFHVLGPDIYSTKKHLHQNPQTRKILNRKQLQKYNFKLRIKYALRFLIKIKHFYNKNKIKKTKDITPYIDQIRTNCLLHGSCYIFSPLYIKNNPGNCFYTKTFMYMEAEILYYLCRKRNEKIIYDPRIKIFHHEDVSTDAAHADMYQKSIFSLKCLINSTQAFISLMNRYGD